MSSACIAIALTVGVDVSGLRKLHDYGDLDDAGVVRAYEQMRTQRLGRLDLPGYLTTIERVACVVDDGHDARLHIADDTAGEPALFDELYEAMQREIGPPVVWHADELAPLRVRAALHSRVLPPVLAHDGPPANVLLLSELMGARGYDDIVEAESEVTRLFALDTLADIPQPEVVRAVNRYRLWLSVQYSRGRLAHREYDARLHAIAEAVAA